MNGIDVSRWQGTIDWQAVANAGIGFAAISAGDGTTYHDPRFAENWRGAKAANVLRAGYLFCRAGQDPVAQAAYLAAVAAGADLAPWADFESASAADLPPGRALSWLAQFLVALEERSGRTPTIYTGPAFWRSLGRQGQAAAWARYPLAVAHYGVARPDVPPPWTAYAYWQHSSAGRVPGIGGPVDLDISSVNLVSSPPSEKEHHPFMRLNQPIIEVVINPVGAGYWEVAADGGVFAFGDAHEFPENSLPNQKLNAPITSAKATATGQGLLLSAADGGIFTLGDAVYAGSVPALPS